MTQAVQVKATDDYRGLQWVVMNDSACCLLRQGLSDKLPQRKLMSRREGPVSDMHPLSHHPGTEVA